MYIYTPVCIEKDMGNFGQISALRRHSDFFITFWGETYSWTNTCQYLTSHSIYFTYLVLNTLTQSLPLHFICSFYLHFLNTNYLHIN